MSVFTMMTAPALGVLDQSPVSDGMSRGDALRHSIELAKAVDRLGYSRFWVAEHHGTRMLAGTSPEILIGPIAAATTRLRVGSGGVMLPHYSPLKVAESFGMLSSLYPGRIDLALGRAAGTDPMTAFALQRDRRQAAPDDFPEQLVELLAYVRDGLPDSHRFAPLSRTLMAEERPEPWLLGSSPQSSLWAADFGLPYAFADFINPSGAAAARAYRANFTPSTASPEPRTIVAAWALVAETDAEARRLVSSAQVAFLHFLQGTPIPIPPPDVAQEFLARNPEALAAFARHRRAVIGTAPGVAEGLRRIAAEYQADEVLVVTITWSPADRIRSYELLAKAFAM